VFGIPLRHIRAHKLLFNGAESIPLLFLSLINLAACVLLFVLDSQVSAQVVLEFGGEFPLRGDE